MSKQPPPVMPATNKLLVNPRQYVKNWLTFNNINIQADGSLSGKTPKHKLFLSLWLDYEEERRDYNAKQVDPKNRIPGVGKETLLDALDELIQAERERQVAALAASIACAGEDLTELENFVEAVTGRRNAVEIAAMAHFCWLVKRKLNGLPVTWHLMPILNGIQGVGKSTAIKELLKPVAAVTTYLKLDELTDSRCAQALEMNFVIVTDEMMGAAKTEIETLKNRITADTIGLRPMRSNDIVNLRVNATFIGSTNRDVATLVRDSTGMRRFVSINCKETLMTGIYGVDFTKLWQGIDENRAGTYLDAHRDALAAVQKELETPDEVSMFVEEYGLAPVPGNSTSKVLSSSLYGNFKQWAAHHGHPIMNSVHFGRRLATLKIQNLKSSSAGCSVRYYVIAGSGLSALRSDANRLGDI